MTVPELAEVVVIGAGLAGLAAARVLHEAGRDVHIVEASDDVGGRVRTDMVDGFRLDRGFQVLLTAYPEVSRQLNVPALRLQHFDQGAGVWIDGKEHRVADPFRAPTSLPSALLAPIGSPLDKVRVAAMRRRLLRTDSHDLLRGDDLPTISALRARGFSTRMIDLFFRPLFGGIQLDTGLATSSRMFDVIFRSLSEGGSAVPADGMGAISQQMAAHLPPDRIHLNRRVVAVTGASVQLDGGASIDARSVVVAVEGPESARLVGTRAVGSRPVTAVWFGAPRAPVDHKLVMLTTGGPAANVVVMSNVAASYAPAGQALVVAAVPGVADPAAEAAVRAQLAAMFGPRVADWRHLRTHAIAHGQPDQAPPFSPKRIVALGDGLFVCGDHRDTGSIQGALYSGRRAGTAVASFLAN
jgi:protoporphyrinogen oxidase